MQSFEELLEAGRAAPVPAVPPKPDNYCTIMYTSGTTGGGRCCSLVLNAHKDAQMHGRWAGCLGGWRGCWLMLVHVHVLLREVVPSGLSVQSSVPPRPPTHPDTHTHICTHAHCHCLPGDPKGVLLTHSAVIATVNSLISFLYDVTNFHCGIGDSMLSYLPLAHIFDRCVGKEMMPAHLISSSQQQCISLK